MREQLRKELEAMVPPEPEELVSLREVMGIVGLYNSGSRATMVELAQRNGIPTITSKMNGRWKVALTVPNAKRLIEAYYIRNRRA